ncbi:MAG TPA: MFS transporter [Allosphingosinicella sp.]|nr:MFS transporter [Allosphingosinicella sp.]
MTAAAGEPLLSRGYRARLLAVLLAVSTFNYTDRILVPVLAEPLKQDLHLSDLQFGLLTGLGFALVYTLVGLPIAWLADRYNRTRILAGAVTFWSLLTVASGFAANFVQLLIARAGVGVGEAGFLPPTASLLSDHYPANRRASAMSIVQLGSPASTIMGGIVAAWIASIWGWRAAFIIVGIPGILLGLSLLFLLKEPRRGLVDGVQEKPVPAPLWRTIRTLLGKRSFIHLMIGGALAMFGLHSIGSFLTAYYIRVHGLGLGEAGTLFGIVQFIAAVAGLLAGGFGSDRIAASTDARWRAWVPAVALALAAPFYFFAFLSGSLWLSASLILLGGVSFFIFFVPTLAITQNLVPAQSRATAIAVYSLAANLIGTGFGPTVTGFISDRVAKGHFTAGGDYPAMCPGGRAPGGAADSLRQACEGAGAYGLSWALALVSLLFLWAALHYFLLGRTIREESHVAA